MRLRRKCAALAAWVPTQRQCERYDTCLRPLAKRYSPLRDLTGDLCQDLASIDVIVEEELRENWRERLLTWHWRIYTDDRAVSRWVRAESAPAAPTNPSTPVHPQLKVQTEANKWAELWQPHELPPDDALDEFCGWIPEGGFAAESCNVTGKQAAPQDCEGERRFRRWA